MILIVFDEYLGHDCSQKFKWVGDVNLKVAESEVPSPSDDSVGLLGTR